MKYKEYANSKYCYLTHHRFKMFFNLVNQGEDKEAHNVSIDNLIYTMFTSQKLTEKSARTMGEMLIRLADLLKSGEKK